MIIQKVIKGLGGLADGVDPIPVVFVNGLICRWWQEVNPLPMAMVSGRLNERNLSWHQNHYEDLDPQQHNEPFCKKTPFLSTTAGTVERDIFFQTNAIHPAWIQALQFATDGWSRDGFLFYCYVFVLGKKALAHSMFAEELRELNIYTGYSPFHPEGEVTAKISIPTGQIEKAEYWSLTKMASDLANNRLPTPDRVETNPKYLPPDDYSNVRDLL